MLQKLEKVCKNITDLEKLAAPPQNNLQQIWQGVMLIILAFICITCKTDAGEFFKLKEKSFVHL